MIPPRRSSVKIAGDQESTYDTVESIAKIVKETQEVNKRKKKLNNTPTKNSNVTIGKLKNTPSRNIISRNRSKMFTLPVKNMPSQKFIGGKIKKSAPVKPSPQPKPTPPPEASENIKKIVEQTKSMVKPPVAVKSAESDSNEVQISKPLTASVIVSSVTKSMTKSRKPKPQAKSVKKQTKKVVGRPSSVNISPNTKVNNKVKNRVIRQVQRYLSSLPPDIRSKVGASGLIEAIRMAKTVGELERTIGMINSSVRYVALKEAKAKALKYLQDLPDKVKDVLGAGGIYDTYLDRIKHAKSVEELNKIMKEFSEKANDYLASTNVKLARWWRSRFNNITAKFEEYRSLQLSKEQILKWLESLPTQVKQAMGEKYEEAVESVKEAGNAEELQQAVKEANRAVKESAAKAEAVSERDMQLFPGLSTTTAGKLLRLQSFENAKESVLDYLNSLPPDIRSKVDVADLELGVREAKSAKDLEKVVEEINKQVKEAYAGGVKGQASIAIGGIPATAGIAHAAAIESERWTRYAGLAGKPEITKEGKERLEEWVDKVASALVAVDPQLYQEFKSKYGREINTLMHTNDVNEANVLAAKLSEGANALLLSYYKNRIAEELGKYKGELSPLAREGYSSMINQFINAVKKAKNLAELRQVVDRYNKQLQEANIIVGRGLENLEIPDIVPLNNKGSIYWAMVQPKSYKKLGMPTQEEVEWSKLGNLYQHLTVVGGNASRGAVESFGMMKTLEADPILMMTKKVEELEKWAEKQKNPLLGLAGGAAAGAASFGLGVLEGVTAPVRPATYVGLYQMATNPVESFKGIGKYIEENPVVGIGRISGNVAGGLLLKGFSAGELESLVKEGTISPQAAKVLWDMMNPDVKVGGFLKYHIDRFIGKLRGKYIEEPGFKFTPAHTDPMEAQQLIQRFANTRQTTIHISKSSAWDQWLKDNPETAAILLKGFKESAHPLRYKYDLLHFYKSLPTDEGVPQAYMAYGTGAGEGFSGAEFKLFTPKVKALVFKNELIKYIAPKPGEDFASYVARVGQLSGETVIPPENVYTALGKGPIYTVERQVITPAKFKGNLIEGEYPGSLVKFRGYKGFTYWKRPPPGVLKKIPILRDIMSDYYKVHIIEAETAPVENTGEVITISKGVEPSGNIKVVEYNPSEAYAEKEPYPISYALPSLTTVGVSGIVSEVSMGVPKVRISGEIPSVSVKGITSGRIRDIDLTAEGIKTPIKVGKISLPISSGEFKLWSPTASPYIPPMVYGFSEGEFKPMVGMEYPTLSEFRIKMPKLMNIEESKYINKFKMPILGNTNISTKNSNQVYFRYNNINNWPYLQIENISSISAPQSPNVSIGTSSTTSNPSSVSISGTSSQSSTSGTSSVPISGSESTPSVPSEVPPSPSENIYVPQYPTSQPKSQRRIRGRIWWQYPIYRRRRNLAKYVREVIKL